MSARRQTTAKGTSYDVVACKSDGVTLSRIVTVYLTRDARVSVEVWRRYSREAGVPLYYLRRQNTGVGTLAEVADDLAASYHCGHELPVEFGASQVSWDDAGLVGTLVENCRECGMLATWRVEAGE